MNDIDEARVTVQGLRLMSSNDRHPLANVAGVDAMIDEAPIRERAEAQIVFGIEEDRQALLSLLDAARRERDEARARLARVADRAPDVLLGTLALEADRDAFRAALERVAATDLTHMITRAAAFDVLEHLVIGAREALAAVQAKPSAPAGQCPSVTTGGGFSTLKCERPDGHGGSHEAHPYGEGGLLSWPDTAAVQAKEKT